MATNQSEMDSSTTTATPPGMRKSEVYIMDSSPPYETPLDLRYPLHWDSDAEFVKGGEVGVEPPELELARAELRPLGVLFNYGQAYNMSHHKGLSPFFFMVDFEEADESTWRDIHQTVLDTIRKHFGHKGEFKRPVIRYVRRLYYDKHGADAWEW